MKNLLLCLFLAFLPAALWAQGGTAIPGGTHADPFVITKSGRYYLAASRVMATKGDAIIKIKANEVTLDLNGCSLSYPDDDGTGAGVTVVGSNVEIRNGSVVNIPGLAIQAEAYSNNIGLRVIDVRIASSMGIRAQGTSALIERCQILDTRGDAIDLGFCGTVKGCVIRSVLKTNEPDSGNGVVTDEYGSVLESTIDYTQRAGVICKPHTVVKNNRISATNVSFDPGSAGICVFDANHCTISGNTLTTSFAAGVRVDQKSYYTAIEQNVITDTREAYPQVGYGVVTSNPHTMIRNNVIRGNATQTMVSGQYTNGGGNQGH